MKKAIARIKLSPGSVAWYDSLTGVYLTMDSPEAIIYDNYEFKNIRSGIRHKTILLKEGTIPSLSNIEIVKKQVKESTAVIKTEAKIEPVKTEHKIEEEPKKQSSQKGKKGKSKKQSSQDKETVEKKSENEVTKKE